MVVRAARSSGGAGGLPAASSGPGSALLLIADDVQWADGQSLRVIHYLLRTAPSARLLIAATARREELDEGHPLADLATGLQALGRFTEIGLGRLGRDDTALLAERIMGAPLDAAGAGRLYGDSEGNPCSWLRRCSPMRRPRLRCRR
jgi:predicted ATPase